MQTKQIAGAGLGALNLSAAILLIWKGVRWIVGLFGDGQTASDMIGLVEGWPVNWTVIYLVVFLFSGLLLLSMYWPFIASLFKEKHLPSGPYWDMPIIDAANYIAFSSVFGETLNDRERLDIAADAIKEAAVSKRILAVGRKQGAASATIIKAKEWKTLLLEIKVTLNNRHDPLRIQWINMTDPKNGSLIYEGIVLNRNAVLSEWTPKRDWRL
jgi:hypothetical protein